MIYQLKHFTAQEVLDPETFQQFGAGGLRYFRAEILAALDWRRENYPTTTGKRAITVNNWATGGQFHWSGLRLPGCPEYKEHSGHSFGAAIDDRAEGCTPDEMRAWILEQYDIAKRVQRATWLTHPVLGIRRMEIGTPTWTHTDCLEWDGKGIWMVSP
jgi:hypothetical protein